MTISPVSFATDRRIHIGIAVRALDASVAFYRTLFDQAPTKLRADYAKFEVAEPPVNFTLNVVPEAPAVPPPAQHFGIQLKDTDVLKAVHERARAAALDSRVEDARTCCYAVADKVWLRDPDGHQWELFVTLQADADVHSLPPAEPSPTAEPPADPADVDEPCCAPTCCT